MAEGFSKKDVVNPNKKNNINEKKLGSERMFSWSPWPPANFQKRYPAFPLIMTILLLLIGKWYISLTR